MWLRRAVACGAEKFRKSDILETKHTRAFHKNCKKERDFGLENLFHFDAQWPDRPLIVAGNEGDGLPEAFLRECDLQLSLPVYGRIDSLNVAVAASVAMYAFRGSQARAGG